MEIVSKDNKRIAWIKIAKRISIAFLFQLLLYAVQYIFVPVILFPDPQDTTLSNAIIIMTTAIISFAGFYWFVPNVLYWIVTIPIYYLLVNLYCPEGLYSINYWDPQFAYLGSPTAETMTILVLFLEVCVWIFVMLLRFAIRRLRAKS